jgi:hypothetical protein
MMPRTIATALALMLPAVGWAREQQVRQIPRRPGLRNQVNARLNPQWVNQAPAGQQRIHEPFVEPMTARKIRTAIDDAVMYLRSRQHPGGAIGATGRNNSHAVGGTALAALAMLAAGADPASDIGLQKALRWLAEHDIDHTYCRGISANTWEYALRKAPYEATYRAGIERDFDWLMKATANNPRAWRYRMGSRDWDNSCSQYGVLGIWAAQRAGLDPGDAFWKKMSKHFLGCQNHDGGWSYMTGGSTPNMTTAGLASMFLVFDMYHGKRCYTADDPRTFTTGKAAKVLASLERGMTWLGKSKSNQKATAYYLYGIERTGVASGRKYFGGEDWFRKGALAVLKSQRSDGSIPIGRWGNAVVRTSWCVLFLVYGGAPVAFDKLEYGDGADWNLNPRDLANLSRHLWSAYERPLNWHVVGIDDPVTELEAPILFISGSKAASFDEKQVLKLREYVQRGGTILAEPSDHSPAFEKSMHELVAQVFPENIYPDRSLRPLPADHGVYTVMKQTWTKRPEFLGVSDGSRTVFLLSKGYLSGTWQKNETDTDAFKVAMNLLFYATDLAALRGRFSSMLPDTPAAKRREMKATIARVRHGAGRGWAAGELSWRIFAPYAAHVTGCPLQERPAVSLGADDPAGIRLLHLTGREPLRLTRQERETLKTYVLGGGTLLVDAYAGSTAFAASARKEIEATFGKLRPLDPGSALALGRFQGGSDLSRGIRFKLPARRLLRKAGVSTQGQKLEAVVVGGRLAVVFSRFDLTGAVAGSSDYGAAGYKPASARRIVGNVLAYVMAD